MFPPDIKITFFEKNLIILICSTKQQQKLTMSMIRPLPAAILLNLQWKHQYFDVSMDLVEFSGKDLCVRSYLTAFGKAGSRTPVIGFFSR